jgi:hypothetical protein
METTEMWFLRRRRMMKVKKTARIPNDVTLKQMNEERRLIKAVRKRQSQFIGYTLAETKLTSGQIIGKRDTERQKILNSLKR